jgi:hypothetical protein
MDPDPEPTPDTTPFFSDFKGTKKNSYFLLKSYPQAHYLTFGVKILFFAKIL